MQRVKQLEDSGVEFVMNCNVGTDISFDAITPNVTPCSSPPASTRPAGLREPGSDAAGIMRAIDYLTVSNKLSFGDDVPESPTAR
ncbi:MAG: hypothetical protein R3D78_12245 [Paracoccaceae bacterium]